MPEPESVVHSDPEILGGTPVFVGTRAPLKNLIDYLAAGDSLDRFLDDFPSVTREPGHHPPSGCMGRSGAYPC